MFVDSNIKAGEYHYGEITHLIQSIKKPIFRDVNMY